MRRHFIYHKQNAWLAVTIDGFGFKLASEMFGATAFETVEAARKELDRLKAGGWVVDVFEIRTFTITEEKTQ